MTTPILYSYRSCPYAMRARMALQQAAIAVEIREISLSAKPQHMLEVSPKATVPVLVLADGKVIDESLQIMQWALVQSDKDSWLTLDLNLALQLIDDNDTQFKRALDVYKYPERHPEKTQQAHRSAGELFLQQLEQRLEQHEYLLKDSVSIADVAIFPFVRQFAAVDSVWFGQAPYPKLQLWLNHWLSSALFISVMQKYPTYIEK
ncbi:MAG: glutathione S-transferase [Methylophilus sp.]